VPEAAVGLSGYDAVLLGDVPARSFREGQMSAIAEYVERSGGGLIMIGDTGSFGPGGYAGTPIEPVLPVDIRSGGGGSAGIAVVLVIDKSGSMGPEAEGPARLDVARKTAAAIERLLGPRDALGAIAFDREPQVLLPLSGVEERSALGPAMENLGARGGTAAGGAVALARSWLRETGAARKQAILVSDGELEEGDLARVVALAESGGNILLSVIGVGADADRETLTAIARAGGGDAIFLSEADATPEILAREALALTRTSRIERDAALRIGERHPIGRGLDFGTLPRVSAYAATASRASATTLLATDRGEPIVAAGYSGIGRVVAVTSGELSRWPSFEALLLSAARWAGRGGAERGLHPRISIQNGRGSVAVDAFDEDGWFRNGLSVSVGIAASSLGSPGETASEIRSLPLSQTAPGLYEGAFDLPGPGAFVLSASAKSKDGSWEESVPFGLFVPRSTERQATEPDLEKLRRIAELGGGRLLEEPRELSGSRRTVKGSADPSRALAAMALFVFLLHVARRGGSRSKAS
jgi:hypothetical protein